MDQARVKLFAVEHLVWIIAIFGYVVFVFLEPRLFANPQQILTILDNRAAVGVLAVAEALCLISGSMDLSLAAISGVAGAAIIGVGTAFGFTGLPGIIIIFLPLLVGAALGAINGLFVTRTGVHPFLITLATLLIFRASRQMLPHAYSSKGIFSGAVLFPGGGSIGWVPISVIIVLVLIALAWVLLSQTRTGIRIYAMGDNSTSAEMMGIKISNKTLMVHIIAGLIAGLGGLLFVGQNAGYIAGFMDGSIFMVFAMAVFGGIALQGGRGNIEDVLAGIFFLATLVFGFNTLNINVHLIDVLVGIFIIIGVIINSFRFQLRDRLARASS